jgi:N-acetylmuramoyl-L-alanine amidase
VTRIAAPPILVCSQWGARKPRVKPTLVGRPNKIIEHHTDGHASKDGIVNASPLTLAVLYARSLQNNMMDKRGWNDSGHSFLVMRSGIIVQGRWGTVTAIEHGRMVESAHCPGQNDQPGIEHEHLPGELLTKEQLHSTVWLQAWICDRTGIRSTELYGHGHFYNTACPSNLATDIPSLRLDVARYLNVPGRYSPIYARSHIVRRALRRELST